ncbi:MAG: carboxymuconolactone decarboxylase family protein [Planctomycetes bacterium]|nr:carboxymuconolactone decarboxylase family protein [Planctomycetota bacterium]
MKPAAPTDLETRLEAAPALARRLILFAAMVHSPEAGDRALAVCAARAEDRGRVLELVLQAFLFAGFPRLINCLRAYRRHFEGSTPEPRSQAQADIDRWRARGEELFRRIYDKHADRVLADLDHFHEDLRDWIIVDAYGKILGRPALEASERELAAVTALIVSGDLLQLSSHIRGALHCGADRPALDLALEAAALFAPPERLDRAHEILAKVAP